MYFVISIQLVHLLKICVSHTDDDNAYSLFLKFIYDGLSRLEIVYFSISYYHKNSIVV